MESCGLRATDHFISDGSKYLGDHAFGGKFASSHVFALTIAGPIFLGFYFILLQMVGLRDEL